MALTKAETDALAGKIARLALLWAGGDPARIAEAITILESSPALNGRCRTAGHDFQAVPGMARLRRTCGNCGNDCGCCIWHGDGRCACHGLAAGTTGKEREAAHVD